MDKYEQVVKIVDELLGDTASDDEVLEALFLAEQIVYKNEIN